MCHNKSLISPAAQGSTSHFTSRPSFDKCFGARHIWDKKIKNKYKKPEHLKSSVKHSSEGIMV